MGHALAHANKGTQEMPFFLFIASVIRLYFEFDQHTLYTLYAKL